MGSKKKPKRGKTTAVDDDVFDDEYKPVDVMANLQMESSPSPLPPPRAAMTHPSRSPILSITPGRI